MAKSILTTGDTALQDVTLSKERITGVNGASAGKEIALTKVLTMIGRPGVQVAVIARGPQGYSITHVDERLMIAFAIINLQFVMLGGRHNFVDSDKNCRYEAEVCPSSL